MVTVTRKIRYKAFYHIYQRTVGGGVIFYDDFDYLFFLSLVSVTAEKLGVEILAICPMPDHLHLLARAPSQHVLALFIKEYTRLYSLLFNRDCGRSGPLFRSPYGAAPKTSPKYIRTTIAYVFNNPVEKNLSNTAEEWKWNLLAYGRSSNPFSHPVVKSNASRRLLAAMQEVSSERKDDSYLNYTMLRRLFRKLSETEKEQLTDHILSQYCPLRFDMLKEYYGDYETMILAINSNTGSEHDLKEDTETLSDTIYGEMAKELSAAYPSVKRIITLPESEKTTLWENLAHNYPATPRHLSKFLHLPLQGRHK